MSKTMRAAVVREFGRPLEIAEVPRREPGPGQIEIRIEASGVCHTDMHAADGDWPVKPKLPLIPGHEGVGFVSRLGRGVTGVKEGDRVGAPWLHSACGTCEHCVGGWETLCESQTNTGYGVDGGYADYVLADPRFVGRLPEGAPFPEIAPILCAGVTVYKGLKETGAKPGDWVAISGIGGLGHVAVQYAKAMGLQVVAVDVAEDKLALARRLGADIAIDASRTDPVDETRRSVGGVHGALVTAVSTAAFAQAVGMLRRGGTMALVGLPPGEFPTPIFEVVLKRLTIRGSIVGTRLDLAECLGFAARGAVKANVETAPLEAINEVFDRLRAGRIDGRAVLTF